MCSNSEARASAFAVSISEAAAPMSAETSPVKLTRDQCSFGLQLTERSGLAAGVSLSSSLASFIQSGTPSAERRNENAVLYDRYGSTTRLAPPDKVQKAGATCVAASSSPNCENCALNWTGPEKNTRRRSGPSGPHCSFDR